MFRLIRGTSEGNPKHAVFVTVLFAIFLWLLASQLYSKHKFTWFWNPDVPKLDVAHSRRVAAARAYFNNLEKETEKLPSVTSDMFLCIVVTAAPRANDDVILQNLHGLLALQGSSGRRVVKVVYTHSRSFPFLADLSRRGNLSNILQVSQSKPSDRLLAAIHNLRDPIGGEGAKFFTEHRATYISALAACEGYMNALVLEDDVFPATNYVDRITEVLAMVSDDTRSRLGFIKLYFGNLNWDLYNNKFDQVLFGFMASGLASFVTFVISRLTLRGHRALPVFLWIVWTAYFAVLLLALGKRDVVPTGRGLFSISNRCCSLAHLYTQQGVTSLKEYLESSNDYNLPLDFLLDNWLEKENRERYVYEPHLFQHIGVYSSHPHGIQGDYRQLGISPYFEDDLFDGQLYP